MAMSFTAITEDICKEEGTFMMNFLASGTILAGQSLEVCGETSGTGYAKVRVSSKDHGTYKASSNGFIGVAAYSATDNNPIAVLPVGNKVTVRASGAITVGDTVKAVSKGYFQKQYLAASGTRYQGIALETFTSDEAAIIMLV
jgi:hypothetical protein